MKTEDIINILKKYKGERRILMASYLMELSRTEHSISKLPKCSEFKTRERNGYTYICLKNGKGTYKYAPTLMLKPNGKDNL